MKPNLALWLLVFFVGCAENEYVLRDDWTVATPARYVVGTTTQLRLTERTPNPDYEPSFFGDAGRYRYRDVERVRITSSNPEVFEITERGGWVGHARAAGEAWLEARHDGEVVLREQVLVGVPDRLEITPGLLESFASGGLFDDVAPVDRVVRVEGAVVDLTLGCYVGELSYASNAPILVETELAVQQLTDWPPSGLRILGGDLGTRSIAIEVAGLRRELEVETLALERVERFERFELPALTPFPAADRWHFFTPYADGHALAGSAPMTWHVNGRTLGEGGVLGCIEGGEPVEVEAQIGARVERFVAERGCAQAVVMPWLEPPPG